jgi:hypothetical protein
VIRWPTLAVAVLMAQDFDPVGVAGGVKNNLAGGVGECDHARHAMLRAITPGRDGICVDDDFSLYMGHYIASRTSVVAPHMSAFGSKADMTYCSANVRLLPKADIRRRDLRFENWHRFFKPSQRSVACAGEISSKSLPDQRQ